MDRVLVERNSYGFAAEVGRPTVISRRPKGSFLGTSGANYIFYGKVFLRKALDKPAIFRIYGEYTGFCKLLHWGIVLRTLAK